ncbi:MAG: hypothetical protein JXB26_18365 [Candidatus Aminicenantes bacterium]|nr:hypothetical protein [Candidatus Aminicenantes bacterium]
MLDLLSSERKDFKIQNNITKGFPNDRGTNRKDLLESISELISDGIFIQGIEIRCNYCGSRFFYSLDEIKQKVVCKGCQTINSVGAESNWSYKLNDFLRNAFAFHGVFPLAWVLGELLNKSEDSFIFMPCITLHKDYKTRKAYAELDLTCIFDGQFLIGEIQSQSNKFSEKEINKLADLSFPISPHKVLVSAFWDNDYQLNSWKMKLEAKLKNLNIEAIKPDKQIFKPEYYI